MSSIRGTPGGCLLPCSVLNPGFFEQPGLSPGKSGGFGSTNEVIEKRRIPNRPDALDTSEHGPILWRKLLQCWAYKPEDRVIAGEIDKFAVDDMINYLTGIWGLHDWTTKLDLMPPYAEVGGGYGDIYRMPLSGGTAAAVKVARSLLISTTEDLRTLEGIARELDTWSRLRHVDVLEFFGVASYNGQIVLISPWMENGSVSNFISKNPEADRYDLVGDGDYRAAFSHVLLKCIQLANVVAYLHDIDVIHGDLKGANTLVSPEGILKLTDFGTSIAREDTLRFQEPSEDDNIGTLRWMSPEVMLRESGLSRANDVWSLGMTMLEIVTNKVPYSTFTEMGAMHRVTTKKTLPDPIGDTSARGIVFWQ
ncbi:kinase-like protein, partial [Ceratobasidium sp. AG-I]